MEDIKFYLVGYIEIRMSSINLLNFGKICVRDVIPDIDTDDITQTFLGQGFIVRI